MTRLASLALATLIATTAIASAANYDSPRDLVVRGNASPAVVGTAAEVPSRTVFVPSDRAQPSDYATVSVLPSIGSHDAANGPGTR